MYFLPVKRFILTLELPPYGILLQPDVLVIIALPRWLGGNEIFTVRVITTIDLKNTETNNEY